jgi:hypothetical protein
MNEINKRKEIKQKNTDASINRMRNEAGNAFGNKPLSEMTSSELSAINKQSTDPRLNEKITMEHYSRQQTKIEIARNAGAPDPKEHAELTEQIYQPTGSDLERTKILQELDMEKRAVDKKRNLQSR